MHRNEVEKMKIASHVSEWHRFLVDRTEEIKSLENTQFTTYSTLGALHCTYSLASNAASVPALLRQDGYISRKKLSDLRESF